MFACFIPSFCLNLTSSTQLHTSFCATKPDSLQHVCSESICFLQHPPPNNSKPTLKQAVHEPQSKMGNSSLKLFFLVLWVVGALSMPPSRPLLVGENACSYQRNLSRSPRTISSLNPLFLFEAVRGLANIFQGLSSFLFTGTSIFGLLNLFKPQAGAGGDVPGQLFGGGAFPGNQNLAGIGSGSLPGLFGTLSPKSNDSA